MRNLLFIIAAVLVIIWAAGFFLFRAGNSIHLLPVIAIAFAIRGFIKDAEPAYIIKNHTWKV